MSTSEETRRGGRDGMSDGPGGAARNGPDDDAFEPAGADDDEVVYEWVADDDPESPAETADRRMITRAGLRETLVRLRADWRGMRRRAALALAVAVVTGAVSVGATAWFDTVARGADEATVADLALDAVVDGDPTLATFDVDTTRGSAQFVLEVANNGPAAVTLVSLSIDAGTLMTSTGWRPIGSPRIAAGATGSAALTVDVDCRLLMLGQAISSDSAGPAGFTFPDVHAAVRTGDGEVRQVLLSSRKHSRLDSATRTTDLPGSDAPQVTMTGIGQCTDVLDQQRQRLFSSQVFPGGTSAPPIQNPEQMTVTYTGVVKAATQSAPEYVLGFRAHNPAAVTMMSFSDPGKTDVSNTDLVTMTPSTSTVPAGGNADFTLTVKIAACRDGLAPEGAAQYFVRTAPQYDSNSGGSVNAQFGSISHFLTGTGVQLALDELAQRKAACP